MADKSERRTATVETAARLYQRFASPLLHGLHASLLPVSGGCRYQPTCSEYAAIAISRYGWLRGMSRAFARLLRCNPWSRGGFDPVP